MRVGFVDDEPQIYPMQYGGKARTIRALAESALRSDVVDEVTILSRSIEDDRDEFAAYGGIRFVQLDDQTMMGRIAEEAESSDVLSIHTCSFTFPRISEVKRKAALIYHLHDVMLTTADKGSHMDKALGGDWDAIVTPSNFAAQTYRNFSALVGRTSADIHTIPRGIDPSLFHKVSKEEAKQKINSWGINLGELSGPVLFFPGRADVGKGDDRIARICESLANDYPDFTVVTTSDVKSSRQHPNVVHVGWQASDRLRYFYSISDLTLALSKLPESFSQVCIESVACDTPVITFPFGNLPDLSRSLPAVQLCEPTTEAAIQGVKQLLKDRAMDDKLQMSRYAIESTFSIEATSKIYLQLYADIVKNRREQLCSPSLYFMSPFASIYAGKAHVSNSLDNPIHSYDLAESEELLLACCTQATTPEEMKVKTGLDSGVILRTLRSLVDRKIIMGGHYDRNIR